MDSYGALTLLPAVVAVAMAFWLKRVIPALTVGVAVGALLSASGRPLDAIQHAAGFVWRALSDGSHLWILAFALSLGGLTDLLRASGSSHRFGTRVAQVARTRRGGQVVAWLLGVMFFFDDYANTLFVGSSMAPAARRLRLSREKLAFIIDATAAPVASIAPLSSWIAVELGYIADQLISLQIPHDPYPIFLATIPYRFYPLLMLVFVLLVALSGRDFGPMALAEFAAQQQSDPGGDDRGSLAHWPHHERQERGALLRALPLLFGLAALLGVIYWTGLAGARAAGDLPTLPAVLSNASSSKALVAATLVAALTAWLGLAMVSGARLRLGVLAWAQGVRAMLGVAGVLLLAWALGGVCAELGTARYLADLLGAGCSAAWLPTVAFLISSAVSFATGTSYGTMALIFPLSVPLAHQLAPQDMGLLIGTVASVLSGSVFGDHCSPISDTTIMSALAVECDQLAHVQTQLPYALLVGSVAVLAGSLPVAYGVYGPYLGLALGSGLLMLVLRLLGRPVCAAPDPSAPTIGLRQRS